jgi:hypothetical protein
MECVCHPTQKVLAGEAHKFILVGGVLPSNGRLVGVQPSPEGKRDVCSINGVEVPMPLTPVGSRSESFVRGRAVLIKHIRKAMREKWIQRTGRDRDDDDDDDATASSTSNRPGRYFSF